VIPTEDTYALIRKDDLEWGERDPIAEAIEGFDPQSPEPLLSLLRDNDPLIRRRGLWIFSRLGNKGFVILDAALGCAEDKAQWAKNHLMDGVICYPEKLNPAQAQIVLKLANDPENLVREKVVAFIGFAKRATIEAAIELLTEPGRSDYKLGLRMFDVPPSQAQTLFDDALENPGVVSTFALASITRMARKNLLSAAPCYDGDSYIGKGVKANAERLLRRAQRILTARPLDRDR
jgi:hypothetical protein